MSGATPTQEQPLSGAGIAAALAASTIWGMAPVFFSALSAVPPLELLAHRVLWGCLFTGAFCLATGRAPRIAATLGDRRLLAGLGLSAALISINWFTFLWSVQAGLVTESGLVYFLLPIVSVALGVAVLGARLSRAQWAAVALAGLAVATLAVGRGTAPVIPVVLAVSFACYGLLRKRLGVGAIVGFQVEAMLIAPLALGWLALVHAGVVSGPTLGGGLFGTDAGLSLLLVLAGPVTGLPLILFAEAARRLPYATTGVIQYVNPTLQVAVATLVLGEATGPALWVALGLIWAGLALYSRSLFLQDRAARRARIASAGVATTVR